MSAPSMSSSNCARSYASLRAAISLRRRSLASFSTSNRMVLLSSRKEMQPEPSMSIQSKSDVSSCLGSLSPQRCNALENSSRSIPPLASLSQSLKTGHAESKQICSGGKVKRGINADRSTGSAHPARGEGPA